MEYSKKKWKELSDLEKKFVLHELDHAWQRRAWVISDETLLAEAENIGEALKKFSVAWFLEHGLIENESEFPRFVGSTEK